ncbi:ABC-type spermidine/putrescine transport system, permease component I (plasmid) [Neorhizobium galegae bv. officinalis bv. officinalis str. HAMBI 1141]|uniref:ABC-type spermidine/putrescine transport system, permease component I n=1 Tax=Neorhizobium galegae bv. officinalis bv. officinalis str. HAMBI 1141 TaxID=1028801 RepID=A0A068TGH9_NEOGA|nr:MULTISPECIES: ABC transporter permease [Neorhizobium]MCJ9669620.1 ABC transporter permease [Neorhizobium sp. SHOUNA12B]MCJ9745997.1 ABC transporter permease [Neorhizobium sp. SHOUNA12A]CDN57463.1 ABC-type spermidine/putrescine transport system, permease component I [Neorhizobium galegae bv. officinalis bv. officinalis str. HAMBI 1141]
MSAAALPAAETSPANASRGILLMLLLPGLIALVITFLLPLIWLLRASFASSTMGALSGGDWTVQSYSTVLFDPFYWRVAWNTLVLGFNVAIFAVILSYPIALFLARTESRFRGVLTALAVAPLLTSSVVRTYGWMVILGDRGVINSTLQSLSLTGGVIRLTNNSLGATVALIEILMPYAILAMLSGFGRLNTQLEEAAAMLGANRLRVFTRIILPLSAPGVLTAALLVFVLAISSFVTPRLMGGGRVFVLGTEVFNEATVTLNWPLAAALSVMLLILFSSIILLYQRALRALET